MRLSALQIGLPRIAIHLAIARHDQYLVHADKPHYRGGDTVTNTANDGEPCKAGIPFGNPTGEYVHDQESKWKSNRRNFQPFWYAYREAENESLEKENKTDAEQVDM